MSWIGRAYDDGRRGISGLNRHWSQGRASKGYGRKKPKSMDTPGEDVESGMVPCTCGISASNHMAAQKHSFHWLNNLKKAYIYM
jgi:hypothetical protein